MKALHLSLSIFVLIFLISLPSKIKANVVGADTQNFNPITNGLDFVTVHSSETLAPGVFNFGFFLNLAGNTLPNFEDTNNQSLTELKDTLFSGDINFGLGLARGWDVGVSFPQVYAQSVDNDTFRGEFENAGLTEIRLNTKVRFYGDQSQGIAMVASVNFNQIENNPFTGDNPSPTFNLELAGDTTINNFNVGANIGYRFRNPGDPIAGVPVEPFDDQFIFSGAISYLFTSIDTKLIVETFGAVPVTEQDINSDREVSSLELLGGIKTDLTRNIAFHAGAGTELVHGTAAPDWRIYTGINWAVGPMFKKKQDLIVRVNESNYDVINPEEDPFAGVPKGDRERFVAKDVLFAFDSDDVSKDFIEILARLSKYLERPPGFKSLVIEGHTDSIGPAMYNLDLSKRRAANVRKVLLRTGLPPEKVKSVGFGESRPIADNGNFQGRAKNRRVEFKIER